MQLWDKITTINEPTMEVMNIIKTAWILTSDQCGIWNPMKKNMNKRKITSLKAIDANSIDDLVILEAKICFEDAKETIEANDVKLKIGRAHV